MILKELYAHIGKLLYSVSEIDGSITRQEKERLKKLVKDRLVKSEFEKDAFGTNVAWLTEFEFEYLQETEADANLEFLSFIDFLKLHRTALTPELKDLMVELSDSIAMSFQKVNKKENALLSELLHVMKTI